MSLTITIPVSSHDLPLLEPCVSALAFLGGLQKHAVLFCPAPSVAEQVGVEAARLRAVCEHVHVDPLSREPEGPGRFGAFNMIFRDCVEILARRGNTNPFLWWELDVTPIRAGWADRLELEYNQKGLPFLGVRRQAGDVMRELDGKPLPLNDARAQGDYMVAVGIYPANFKDISTLYKYPDPSGNMPSDVNIRHEINRYLQHTELIGHHWGTANYRPTQGARIECEDTDPKLVAAGFPSYAGVVNPLAVVVHGCKDGSLARLVVEGGGGKAEGGMEQQSNSEGGKGGSDELEELRRQNEELKREIARLSLKQTSPQRGREAKGAKKNGKPEKNGTGKQHGPSDDEIPGDYVLPTLDAVKTLLKKGDNYRVADLAIEFKVPKQPLRKHLTQEGSGIKVLVPSEWVKLEG